MGNIPGFVLIRIWLINDLNWLVTKIRLVIIIVFEVCADHLLEQQRDSVISHMSRSMTKPTKWRVHPAKTQISLDIRPVWSESSLCAQWVARDPRVLYADSEGSV